MGLLDGWWKHFVLLLDASRASGKKQNMKKYPDAMPSHTCTLDKQHYIIYVCYNNQTQIICLKFGAFISVISAEHIDTT